MSTKCPTELKNEMQFGHIKNFGREKVNKTNFSPVNVLSSSV